jgi:hypothetical protein
MTEGSNVGRWASWYEGLTADEPHHYGDPRTYQIAADHLAPCAVVEDWGSGRGYFASVRQGVTVGVDGTASPFADVVADLADYRSDVPGVHLRHVLEHDPRWLDILRNALASATERMVLTVFTPLIDETQQIGWTDALGVPDIAFAADDLEDPMLEHGWSWHRQTIDAPCTVTQYGAETVWRLER